MAYATRYIFNIPSTLDKDVTIRIDEDGYEGAAVHRCTGGAPVLRMEENDCIKGTSLEFPAECIIEDEFALLYTSDPYKYYVTVSVGETVIWRGFITPELYSTPWVDPPYDVTITATDGLGELKMHDFAPLGRQTLEAFLSTLLGATGLSLPIKMISSMATDGSDALSVLAETTVNLDSMEGSSYYDVLQSLLRSMHATLRQYNGTWLIIRETDIESSLDAEGNVLDTAGISYPVEEFGSESEFDIWPVGRLEMSVVPAKNRVTVRAANDYQDSFLSDPDMTDRGWSGTATHYDSDGGFYALDKDEQIYQDYIPPTVGAEDWVDMKLTVKARQSSMKNTNTLRIRVQAYGISADTGEQAVYSYIYFVNEDNDGINDVFDYVWTDSETGYISRDTELARNGNSDDCTEISIPIRTRKLRTGYLSSISRIRISLIAKKSTIYIHSATLGAESLFESLDTSLQLGNAARGSLETIEPAIADSYEGNQGFPFMRNSAYRNTGGSPVLVKEWKSALLQPGSYGEFLAMDYALSVALPRLRLTGKLNTPGIVPGAFYKTKGTIFLLETWSFDMLNDENEVSLLSLPAASLTVTAIKHIANTEDGGTSDMSPSVMPSSLTIAADDVTTKYLAVYAPTGTSWTVSGVPSWLTFQTVSGTGTATIGFTCAANTGNGRSATVIVAGVPVQIYQEGADRDLMLTIGTNVSNPTIAMTVDGASVDYSDGMTVPQGSAVTVTISKSGYTTATDSFTMSAATMERYYTLSESVMATESHPYAISQAAQTVQVNISDPSSHGWKLDYSNEDYFGYITGGAVVSGRVSLADKVFTGVGNAVITLSVSANNNTYDRNVGGNSMAPVYFWDEALGYSSAHYVEFTQLGTASSQVAVTSVTLNRSSLALNTGSTGTLVASVAPSNATNKTIAWSSNNPSVASVDQDGTVHAVSAGSAVITARASDGSGKYATCSVTVTTVNIPVTGVSLNKSSLILAAGAASALTATVKPSSATDKTVSWSSSDTSVATVSSSGVVTAVRTGTATITVRTNDGGYTASCSVTVTANGTMSAGDVEAKAGATSAASVLTCSNIDTTTLRASCPASWVGSVTVDTSGTAIRVRMALAANHASTARSTTVTVTGTDTAGATVTCTFTLTQNANTSSDVPCESMTVTGVATIRNTNNQATYTANYYPSTSTQRGVSWSLTDRSGGSVSLATLEAAGSDAVVRVLEGASGLKLRLTATNIYNASVVASIDIEATYVYSSGAITVSTGDVEVAHYETTDNTPEIELVDVLEGSVNISTTGFIMSASIIDGRLVTVFPQNTGSEVLEGTVTVTATDGNGETVSAIVNYRQRGVEASGNSFAVTSCDLSQEVGKIRMDLTVAWKNTADVTTTFWTPYYTLTAYDAYGNQTVRHSDYLNDKTVAALATETEEYSILWTGILGETTRWEIVLTSGDYTATWSSDGQ